MLTLHWIDLLIIAVYFVGVLGLGLWLARREAGGGEDDYFVAGRSLGWFAVGASLFASNISSEHLIGLAADGFRVGFAVGNYEWGASIVLVVLATVFVPFYVGSKVRTMPEFLERRFGRGARVYLSVVTIVANVLVRISVALFAGAVVMQEMFGIGMWTAIVILAVTTVTYTAAGGLKAVVYTDAVQAIILLAGTILLTGIALAKVGGWDVLITQVEPDTFDMIRPSDDAEMPWPGLLLGVPILGIWYWCTDQVIVQRVLGAKDIDNARMGAIFAAFLKILPVFLFVLPGVCGRVLYPDVEPIAIFPTMLRELLPIGAMGLVSAGLIAALMSSIDSTLNSTGTLVSLDFYEHYRPNASQASVVRVGRITTVAVMLFGMAWVLVVQRAESLFQYLQQVNAAISPPIAAAFLIGVFWRRANHAGVMAALLGGLAVGVALMIFEPFPFLIAAAVTFGISVVLLVGVSLVTPPPRPEQLEGLTWGGVRGVLERVPPAARRRFRALATILVVAMGALWISFAEPSWWASGPAEGAEATTVETRAPEGDETLRFHVREGQIDNYFYRRGPVAAHLLTRSGTKPRVIVAFPAGNAGAALWLGETAEPVTLAVEGEVEGLVREDGLRGVSATVVARGAERLVLTQPVIGSIRVIRDYNLTRRLPDGFEHEREVGDEVVWSREARDEDARYELRLRPEQGTRIERGEGEAVALTSSDGPIRFELVAMTDEPALTPIETERLLNETAADDPAARNALAFLTYEEKMLAGSWRFLTYFGRDTLLSVRLLMPALTPEAVEAGLGAVLERLSPEGAVAHEEDIGEFPAIHGRDAPAYDYKMVDDDFMLSSVVAHYLLDTREGAARTASFFERETSSGESYADALRRNLDMVLARARPYAETPEPANLIQLREDMNVGEWRDSEMGLGGGRIPYNINAALVPAALEAAARLYELPALGADAEKAAEARQLAAAWANAGSHFDVEISAADARTRVAAYAEEVGVPREPALAAVGGPIAFGALALDGDARPLPVMNSDGGFVLLFRAPPPELLERIAANVERPFPAGLLTPVGMVVANPAYATDRELRDTFTTQHYHGTVVWSWQQALMAAGLARQLEREDLPTDTRAALERAQTALWNAIEATNEMRQSELWTYRYTDDRYQLVPFGQGGGDHDESNAAQLWSTVYLAVKPPR